MTTYRQKVSRSVKLYSAIAFFLIIALSEGNAQSIRRQSIGICGTNMVSEGLLVKQTIGQPYATGTYYSNGIGFRPGFQQPAGSNAQSSVIAGEVLQRAINLKVYPNPAAYSFSIESQEVISNGLLKVMDSNGRLIMQEKIAELKNHSIQCENWARGLYLISVTDENYTSYLSKLIITK